MLSIVSNRIFTNETRSSNHGRTGRKRLGGAERNLPDFFGLCPRCQKNFPEKLSKIVVDGVGGGGGVITKNSYQIAYFPQN